MRTIYITAGHQPKNGDRGAISKYGIEGEETRKLTIDLARHLYKEYNIMTYTDCDNLNLREVISWLATRLNKTNILIDIHFNAFNGNVRGTECIIPNNHSNFEKTIASDISRITSKSIPTLNRGVKTESLSRHNKIGILSDHRISAPINILWEVCFIDNEIEMIMFKQNRTNLIKSISEYIDTIII